MITQLFGGIQNRFVFGDAGNEVIAAASSLRKLGATEVAVLKGGMAQWRSDQFPVTTK